MRARVLALIALIFWVAGLQIVTSPIPEHILAQQPQLEAQLNLFTVSQVGWGLLVLGTISFLCALWRPLIRFGLSLMMFASTAWGLLYLVSWYDTGFWRAVYGAAQYVFISLLLFFVSNTVDARPVVDMLEPEK